MWPVRARIAKIEGFSAHADRRGLNRWLDALEAPPRELFVTHGDREVSTVFAAAVAKDRGWRTTVPGPGEPGNETWPGDTWKNGGGPTWTTGVYDPKLNLVYWNTGNAAPWNCHLRKGVRTFHAHRIRALTDLGHVVDLVTYPFGTDVALPGLNQVWWKRTNWSRVSEETEASVPEPVNGMA